MVYPGTLAFPPSVTAASTNLASSWGSFFAVQNGLFVQAGSRNTKKSHKGRGAWEGRCAALPAPCVWRFGMTVVKPT